MAKNNPSRPFESPIKVSHAGDWTDDFRHEIPPNRAKPATKPLPKAKEIKYHRGFDDFQESKTESALIDERLDKAIQDDHIRRNLRNPKNK